MCSSQDPIFVTRPLLPYFQRPCFFTCPGKCSSVVPKALYFALPVSSLDPYFGLAEAHPVCFFHMIYTGLLSRELLPFYALSWDHFTIPGGPEITEQSIQSIFLDFALINSYFSSPWLDRASISHYNNSKIIKFGWIFYILWDISYGLSFSWFARFPEFRGTMTN